MGDDNHGEQWIVVSSVQEVLAAFALEALPPRLPEDPAATCVRRCQQGLYALIRRGEPVALLLTADRLLRRVAFPATGRVARYWEREGVLHFAVTGSPTVFTVSPDKVQITNDVRDLTERNREVLVLDPVFEGNPLIVREWTRAVTEDAAEDLTEADCSQRFELMLPAHSGLSKDEANAFYDDIFALNCEPPYDTGLTFRFCRTFCEPTAEMVGQALAAKGVEVGKAWALAKRDEVMTIETTSRKSCTQSWWYHVVVIARSEDGGYWVFDPIVNLEHGVLTFDEWQQRLGPNLGHVHLKAPNAYRIDCRRQAKCDIDEPCFKKAFDQNYINEHLLIARCSLGCLADIEGDPPFPCC